MNEKQSDTKPESTRRQFVKKLKYVVPAIWTLAAAPEQAWASAPASGTCVPSGGDCTVNDDCCTFVCHPVNKMCQNN